MKFKYLPLLLAIAVAAGFIAGLRVQDIPLVVSADRESMYRDDETWEKAKLLIERYHPAHLNSDSLDALLINRVLADLDAHSKYIPFDAPELYSGKLDGVAQHWGIEAHKDRDTLFVLEVQRGSPMHKKGILPGDMLIERDSMLTWIPLKGKTTSIQVPPPQSFPVQTCVAAVAPEKNRLYIGIQQFGPRTYRDFMQILENQPAARKEIILDLRGNPGGEIEQALKIANQFVSEEKTPLLRMQLANGEEKEFKSSGKNFFEPGTIKILIDEQTASSAEMLAGILKIHADAELIGLESRGKSELMKQFKLPKGILHLKTGHYILEGLDTFGHDFGLIPDREIQLDSSYFKSFSTLDLVALLKEYRQFCYQFEENSGMEQLWLSQCSSEDRLRWLKVMMPHLESPELYDLLAQYDPFLIPITDVEL